MVPNKPNTAAAPPRLELRETKAIVLRGTPRGGIATMAAAITRARQTAAILRAVLPKCDSKNEGYRIAEGC
jgi:hypothetical protein